MVYGNPLPDEVTRVLPAASEKFDEAVFFAKRALEQPRNKAFTNEVRWYVGAHLAAFISIKDAAEVDYERAGRAFSGSPFELELKLKPNEDPVSANRAYRDLRNLRTHFGIALIVLERRRLVYDLASGDQQPPERWYFKPLEWDLTRRLRTPQLCELDVVRVTPMGKRRIVSAKRAQQNIFRAETPSQPRT